MRSVLSKMILAIAILACVPAQANLGQVTKKAAQVILKKMDQNPRWVAFAAVSYFVYRYITQKERPEGEEAAR